MNAEFTPRNVAKFVAKTIVATQAAQLAENTITDHTRFEEDDTVVNIASGLVGWYISDKLKPITDGAVDKVADWYVARRSNKQNDPTPASE